MKLTGGFVLLVASALTATAANVKEFGAVGDGLHDDTAAIQKAIDAGGTVTVPGGTYLTGTLYLRSNGGLDLAPDAVLKATTDPAKWNKRDFCPQQAAFPRAKWSGAHLIAAVCQTNVFLRGGTIDGSGRSFFTDKTHLGAGGRTLLNENETFRPAQMVYFVDCADVRVTDVNLRNSAYWNLFLHGCESVLVRGLNIRSAHDIGEDDGIDIDCCRRVTVSDCLIDVGDDGITLRANPKGLLSPKPCEAVVVNNCVVRSGYAHAFRIGVGSGVIRNCVISDIVLDRTRGGIHICPLYRGGEGRTGVDISDLSIRNVRGDAICYLFVRHDYKFVKTGEEFAGVLRNISFSGLSGTSRLPLTVVGNGRGEISGIRFSDCDLMVGLQPGETDDPGDRQFFMFKDETGLWLERNAEIVRENVCVRPR